MTIKPAQLWAAMYARLKAILDLAYAVLYFAIMSAGICGFGSLLASGQETFIISHEFGLDLSLSQVSEFVKGGING